MQMETCSNGDTREEPLVGRPYAQYFIATLEDVIDPAKINDRLLDLLKSRDEYRTVSLRSVDLMTLSIPNFTSSKAASGISLTGFTHGKKIKENAVLGYFQDPEGGVPWKVQWKPIPGRFRKHKLIMEFLYEGDLVPRSGHDKNILIDFIGNSYKPAPSTNTSSESTHSSFSSSIPASI